MTASARIYTPQHEREVAALYTEEERSTSEIANETGIPYSTIRDILRRQGVEFRPRGGPRVERLIGDNLERTIWLYEQGLSYRQVAEVLGLKPCGVKYRLSVARTRLGRPQKMQGRFGRPGARPIPSHVRRTIEAWGLAG